MLTEEKIAELLANLSSTGQEVAVLQDALLTAERGLLIAETELTYGYAFKGKAVRDRERELERLVASGGFEAETFTQCREEVSALKLKLARAQVSHRVATEACKLCRAMAYEGGKYDGAGNAS